MPTAHKFPLRDGQLQNGFDGEGNPITNVSQLGVGSDGTPATAIHLSPGETPTTNDKGIRFGTDLDVYREGAGSLDIRSTGSSTTLKVHGVEVPVGPHYYLHTQNSPASVWNVAHNLKRRPSVTVTDSGGTVVEGDINHVDEDNLTVSFSAPFSGTVHCN